MAGATITGDYAKLAHLAAGLKKLAGAGGVRDLADALGKAALADVQQEFGAGSDPYGNAWLPVARGGSPLNLTGRLASSISEKPSAIGFMLRASARYAFYHQNGAALRTARVRVRVGKTSGAKFSKVTGKRLFMTLKLKGDLTGGSLPARSIFPTRGLPEKWAADFQRKGLEMISTALSV